MFDAFRQTWSEISAVDPAPIQGVVQSVLHIGSNLRGSGLGYTASAGSKGPNLGGSTDMKLKAMVSLAGAMVEMRAAMRKGDYAAVAAVAAPVVAVGGPEGKAHPHEVWSLVGEEFTNMECEAARRLAADDLRTRCGANMLAGLQSVDLRLLSRDGGEGGPGEGSGEGEGEGGRGEKVDLEVRVGGSEVGLAISYTLSVNATSTVGKRRNR